MVNSNYAKAYVEVLEVLKYVSKADFEKVSKDKIDFYKRHMDTSYEYKIDESLEFEKQVLSDISKAILANIFRDYWATEYQKERILAKEKFDVDKLEYEKSQMYDPNNIFKKDSNDIEITKQSVGLIEYKEKNIIGRIFDKIKSFFKKN
ncbi:MAG: hypothetical protein FWC79_01555 [Oscillospiraceae bacterium]|nr:hypothetical protein [Oscillospiraceae bacterium]